MNKQTSISKLLSWSYVSCSASQWIWLCQWGVWQIRSFRDNRCIVSCFGSLLEHRMGPYLQTNNSMVGSIELFLGTIINFVPPSITGDKLTWKANVYFINYITANLWRVISPRKTIHHTPVWFSNLLICYFCKVYIYISKCQLGNLNKNLSLYGLKNEL